MSAIAAFRHGLGRVARAYWLVLGLWLVTLAAAAPLALVLRGELARHLGSSLAARAAADGVNFDWWNEFLAQASGLGQTFVPRIIGFAAVLGDVSRLADGIALAPALAAVVAAFIVVSIFLAGGTLDRLARDRAIGASGFFAACGVFFFRFLRLGLIAGAVYWLLFTRLHAWLFESLLPSWTADVTAERTVVVYRMLLYLVFGAIVAGVNLVIDYAKVRAVVEDRRSMVMALVASLRFVRRNAGAVSAVYALNLGLFLALLLAYFVAAPGVAPGWRMWLGVAIGQAFIVLRAVVRLQFAASQVALFQGRLAHAAYTAAPAPSWPDSPAAEGLL